MACMGYIDSSGLRNERRRLLSGWRHAFGRWKDPRHQSRPLSLGKDWGGGTLTQNASIPILSHVALTAGKAYAFQFVANGFPYQWRNNGTASTYAGGAYYRIDWSPDRQAWDQIFAIEAAPAANGVAMPEPAGFLLMPAAAAPFMPRRKR
jgi:hypothetical protein